MKNDTSIDVALFGRMVADDASLNEDASSQVAHAISTHAIQSEFDFLPLLTTWLQKIMRELVCLVQLNTILQPSTVMQILPFMISIGSLLIRKKP